MPAPEQIQKKLICYHCGEHCNDESILVADKTFCCNGCKTVYELLDQNKLCNYYDLEKSPGITLSDLNLQKFDYLDDPLVQSNLIDFKNENITTITFFIPQMHCSSCIWLLENLSKINSAILDSRVDFLRKKLSIRFANNESSLKNIVALLASIGYEPQLNIESTAGDNKPSVNKKLYYKIGIAAFCFGNIMLLSFPEYLSIDKSEFFYRQIFAYLNLILALPVFFYSATEYFLSAYKSLKKKVINIDFPISLGIIVIFIRSIYEIFITNGAGYFDSLTGLVFFLLIGKLFQQKTYDSLNFERSYKSYFPLGVTLKIDNIEKTIPVANLRVGNRIIIRKNEIIPADAILFNGEGKIDYSFVTGESVPIKKVSGELIYAGGRQAGSTIELEVIKEVSQSYLTQLWNNDSFIKNSESSFTTLSNMISKYFTIGILLIALAGFAYWFTIDPALSWNVLTAVLIVACPCALALSTPFTLGNTMRIFGRNNFYLKNAQVVEEISKIDSIVFDKTGTITQTSRSEVEFVGNQMNEFQLEMVRSLVRNSTHPLSKRIFDSIDTERHFEVQDFEEHTGSGLSGKIYGNIVKAGSKKFVSTERTIINDSHGVESTRVYISINNEELGYFLIKNHYRTGIEKTLKKLSKNFNLFLLSGDNEGEKKNLKKFFNSEDALLFNQTPQNKFDFVKSLQSKNQKVLMVGDGLNDAGALSAANTGIAITENINTFSPACDAILAGDQLKKISEFIQFSRTSIKIILFNFTVSIAYNLFGLSIALQGLLTPLLAAILMPLSSITAVVIATLSTNLIARKRGLLSRS
jgi:Cu+-exporting ATPase